MNQSGQEISWSLMHPTPLDDAYMRRVVEEAQAYHVDSFEICAECHSYLGGLDGLVLYEDFPTISQAMDHPGIMRNREQLNRIVSLAHAKGYPVYYWHREVMVCPAVLETFPELLDANGEFDLLGASYEHLLRYKLRKAFEAVPGLDGVVLTLTESDFSVIHNSTPELYPPAQVVARLVRIFAEEHASRGKRFILRSFGSIAQDYEDILAGARLAAKDVSFEVETKILPYDFDPFLPDSPYLQPIPHLTIGAECDANGASFLGSGYLPAENVENIVRHVRWGQACQVDRFTIRIDRVGNAVFDTYPINIYAYEQAILDPNITAEEIRRRYAEKHYPASCRDDLLYLGTLGFETIASMNYIDRQLIFHMLPLEADLKWLKAGGIFAVFKDGQKLDMMDGLYAILTSRTTPGRQAIKAEKDKALELAEKGLAMVRELRGKLSDTDYARLNRLWSNVTVGCHAFRALIRVICAYFDDMEEGREEATELERELAAMEAELVPLMRHPERLGKNARKEFVNGMDRNLFKVVGDDLDRVYLQPILGMAQLLREEFDMEFRARKELEALPGMVDSIVPGAVTDEYRCRRYMHASHAVTLGGRLGRLIGNKVFPNGFLEVRMRGDVHHAMWLVLEGEGTCAISVNGRRTIRQLEPIVRIDLEPAAEIRLILRKAGRDYPLVRKIAVCRNMDA